MIDQDKAHDLDILNEKLEFARERRRRLQRAKKDAIDSSEKRIWNQSINVVRKTIKKLKAQIEDREREK